MDFTTYKQLYQQSITNPDEFWAKQAERLDWQQKWHTVKNASYNPVDIKWFEGGKLNVSHNCLDRHLPELADKTAIIWEGDNPNEHATITYAQLHSQVCRCANVLEALGVEKGDRVTIYMPMIIEATVAMLACTRIGAIHSVVFGGFSPEALAQRIKDCDSKFLITADYGRRGGKTIPLKANVDKAIEGLDVKTVLTVCHTGGDVNWVKGRDEDYGKALNQASTEHKAVEIDAEDPMFILYTSGSTGKPKGVLHSTAGYLLYAAMTHEHTFGWQPDDIYWCTADIGWITGHSYIVYGPLANGATTLMFEGVPTYPSVDRFWQVIDKHKVNIFYTAPTAIRALMREGDEPLQTTTRNSLRVLGTVGEPINPEAWNWYNEKVGKNNCPIVDTWWQTETGGHLITPLAGVTPTKPGSATLPFYGIEPVIVDKDGNVLEGKAEGLLCIKQSWPSQMRSVYGDHQRFIDTYFSQYKGLYFTGDGARRDKDGYYWITGRVDDVLNVSGHRLGTAEIESALVAHNTVAEAAVVGIEHEVKGQGIYAYVTLVEGAQQSIDLQAELVKFVATEISPIAKPDVIHFTPDLPKTRSGKIMRRILRKIANKDTSNLGDISTLANPAVVDKLLAG